jgi:hypothetical protein
MKPQTKVDKPLRWRELSIEQRNAIDLLIVGKSDQETADTIGVTRQTVWAWRTTHLRFQSELEQARGALWRLTAERLRGMMTKALDNIEAEIEAGDVKASFDLLRAVGIHGHPDINAVRDWRMDRLIQQQAEAQAAREGLSNEPLDVFLKELSGNEVWRQRVKDITAELWAEYGEPE